MEFYLFFSQQGLAFQYLWPEWIWWAHWANPITASFILIAYCRFAQRFLQTQNKIPRIHKLINTQLWLVGLVWVGVVMNRFFLSAIVIGICTLSVVATTLIAGILSLKSGFRPAQFYLWSFFVLGIGVILYAFKTFGILPNIFLTENGLLIGSIIEVVLLSLALADRINLMQEEKILFASQIKRKNEQLTAQIDKRKRIEGELRHAKENLEEQVAKRTEELEKSKIKAESANQAKSQFLAMMSHEIRTPMNGVLGTAQLLEKTPLNVDQEKYVQLLLKSGQHLMCVINDILDFSKLEAKKLDLTEEPFDPKQVTQEVIDLMKGLAEEKNIGLSSTINIGVPALVLGDAIRLRQVLSNLISNAIKFTHEGEVSVLASVLSHDSPDIELLFRIKDTGIGIPSDKLSDLFKEFSQIDSSATRPVEGTGLGLVICQKLIRLMGGEICVESQIGVGSEFYFSLKLIEIPVIKVISSQQDIDSIELEKIPLRILLVEDNEINQIVAIDMLKDLGYSCDVANNGQEAYSMWKEKFHDLIFMDIHMPILDGIATTEKILQNSSNENRPMIYAMTADVLSEVKQTYLNMGMDGCIAKPIDMSELKAVFIHYTNQNQRLNKQNNASERFQALIDQSIFQKLKPQLRDRLVQMFQKSSPPIIDSIIQAFHENNAHAFAENAHALKGNALAIGAVVMATHCEHLQKKGESNDFSNIDSDISNLQKIYDQTIQEFG